MFDSNSRYYNLPTSSIDISDGTGGTRTVTYVSRRFAPPASSMSTLTEHMVGQGERLDNITARYLGDPTQHWQICDANTALRPEELERESGRPLIIPLPGVRS